MRQKKNRTVVRRVGRSQQQRRTSLRRELLKKDVSMKKPSLVASKSTNTTVEETTPFNVHKYILQNRDPSRQVRPDIFTLLSLSLFVKHIVEVRTHLTLMCYAALSSLLYLLCRDLIQPIGSWDDKKLYYVSPTAKTASALIKFSMPYYTYTTPNPHARVATHMTAIPTRTLYGDSAFGSEDEPRLVRTPQASLVEWR